MNARVFRILMSFCGFIASMICALLAFQLLKGHELPLRAQSLGGFCFIVAIDCGVISLGMTRNPVFG